MKDWNPMRTCTKCNKTLCESQFNWKNKAKGKLSTICKSCHKEYRDAHYKANKEKRIKQAMARRAKAIKENRSKILDYLSKNPCVDCGESDIIVLDFDHFKDKKYNVSNMVRSGYSWETIEEEIKKCEVRCANCHRRKTAKEWGHYRFIMNDNE